MKPARNSIGRTEETFRYVWWKLVYTCNFLRTSLAKNLARIFLYLVISRTVGSRPGGCSRITYTLFKRKKLRLKWRELKRKLREVRAKLCQSRKTCGFRSMASIHGAKGLQPRIYVLRMKNRYRVIPRKMPHWEERHDFLLADRNSSNVIFFL